MFALDPYTNATSAVQATKPAMPGGKPLIGPNGKPVYINADQLEVSPDGRWLYFQPLCGSLSRIQTKWLEATVPTASIPNHIEHFADAPSTGGTAIDSFGNIYLSDIEKQRLLKITPGGSITEVLGPDPRLIWIYAMWIDDQVDLLMPAAQLNRLGLSARLSIESSSSYLASSRCACRKLTFNTPAANSVVRASQHLGQHFDSLQVSLAHLYPAQSVASQSHPAGMTGDISAFAQLR